MHPFAVKNIQQLQIYRQSPVKSPDIKNIIVVTLTFFSTLAKIHTTTAREPSIYN